MERKRMLHAFRAARQASDYSDDPVLPDTIDFQVHLSRNSRAQPFWLVCERDTMLCILSGDGRVEFKDSNVLYHTLEIGDFVYVPAGTPHRLLPGSESVVLRYKAQQPGLEGVAWYCDGCGAEVHRDEFDTAELTSQAGWARACHRFNTDESLRRCSACASVHPPVDLSGISWGTPADEAGVRLSG